MNGASLIRMLMAVEAVRDYANDLRQFDQGSLVMVTLALIDFHLPMSPLNYNCYHRWPSFDQLFSPRTERDEFLCPRAMVVLCACLDVVRGRKGEREIRTQGEIKERERERHNIQRVRSESI